VRGCNTARALQQKTPTHRLSLSVDYASRGRSLAQRKWTGLNFFCVALACLAAAHSSAVCAQSSSDEYKRNIESAVLEFDAGNWAEARVLFQHAHKLRPSARTLRGMGKASFELKEYVRAQRELSSSLSEQRAPLSEPQRQEIQALLTRIERFVGALKMRVKPEDAHPTIMVDGVRTDGELKLDLGAHEVNVRADGYQTLNHKISIEGGKTQHLQLTLNPVRQEVSTSLQPRAADVVSSQRQNEPRHPRDQPSGGVLSQWWFWAIVGAVVVGGAATAVALTAEFVPEPPVPGNTGLSTQVLTFAH
jgi:hypothetical protein